MTLNNSTTDTGRATHSPSADPMIIDIEYHGEVCVLRCKGRFAAGLELDYLQGKLEDIKQLNCSKVLADFREVPFIGSAGLAFLVNLYTSVVTKSGGRFVLAGAVPLVNRVLDLTRLNTVIPLATDLASGFAALRCGATAAGTGP
jgi:anti-anti-sigma factor